MAFGVAIVADGARADDLMDLALVEVHEQVGQPTTYYLRYAVHNVDGDLAPLKEPRLGPGADLAVFQRAPGFYECLVRGPVFSHQIHLTHGVEGSTLEVVGADGSIKMDREVKLTQWADNTADSDAVSMIAANYGLAPFVESTNTRHMESRRTLIQHDTDLNFVRMLARRNGYHFWVRCDDLLIDSAYFKPPVLDDPNAPLLRINIDEPNMDSFDITWDVERPTSVVASSWDGAAKQVIDGSGVPPPSTFSGDVPLTSIASETRSTSVLAAVSDAGDLMGRASGVLMESAWFVQASCKVSAQRLGRIIRTHSVVNVDSVGTRYSGSYYVAGVRHVIHESDHEMYLTLVRNGWKS
ncbi:MAG: hypothetical protein HND48_21790 [Chloroflexi bacterium]|nr:hypothetical protein [Chloroflexota bacterium]